MAREPDQITNSSDIIDVRDIIARVEWLEDELDGIEESTDGEPHERQEEIDELKSLASLLHDLKGYGGDEQWRGDWYPITLIQDSHFEDYARELAEDIGAIPNDAHWPCTCIDWEKAADELRQDYGAVDFDGTEYWYR